MSLRFNNHEEYWKDVNPRLVSYLSNNTKKEVKDLIFTCIAFYGYVSEDIGKKISMNKEVSPKLDLFLAFAFDQLRSALVLYSNLNLAPTAVCARTTFENSVSLRFITQSKEAAKFADLYDRFKNIVRLQAHRDSTNLDDLPEAEITRIKSTCPEWFDPGTGELKKKPHWTAINGMNFEQLVNKTDMKEHYTLYRTTSKFAHASPITLNLYSGPKGFGSVSEERHARSFALLICIFALETLKDYSLFFNVPFDQDIYFGLSKSLNDLS